MFSLSLNLACVSSYIADSRSTIAKTLKQAGLVSPNNRYPCTAKPAATLTDLKTLRTPTQILSKHSFDAVARESGVYSRLSIFIFQVNPKDFMRELLDVGIWLLRIVHVENEVERLVVPRLVMDEMASELAGILFVGAN